MKPYRDDIRGCVTNRQTFKWPWPAKKGVAKWPIIDLPRAAGVAVAGPPGTPDGHAGQSASVGQTIHHPMYWGEVQGQPHFTAAELARIGEEDAPERRRDASGVVRRFRGAGLP